MKVPASVAALMLFFIANCFLNVSEKSFAFSPAGKWAEMFDYRGTETAVNYAPTPPKVLLLGSSLILYPMWDVDRALGARSGDANHYHFAKGLEKELANAGLKGLPVYDLSVGGGMISDSYLLLQRYLRNHPAPKFAVIDCAPRSFYDGGMTMPLDTPIFDYFFELPDFAELHSEFLPGVKNKLEFISSRTLFTYHRRRWLAEKTGEMLPRQTLISSQPVATNTPHPEPTMMQRSLDEYRGRYNLISINNCKLQLCFLKLLCSTCSDNNIDLIVVNMPLSEGNRKLLPDGFYQQFVCEVKQTIASEPNSHFIDLADSDGWTNDVYYDSAHLNHKGGAKFNRMLAQHLAAVPACR